MAVSAIYRYFGSKEHLFQAAHEVAIREARKWCRARLADLRHDSLLPFALGSILASAIDDWTLEHRREAFAWRVCRLAAARDDLFKPLYREWRQLWDGFWLEICRRCGQGPLGSVTSRFFEGESFFHLLRWRRQLDRVVLEETCQGWQGWLEGVVARPAPFRDIARDEAMKGLPPLNSERDPIFDGLSQAAANVLEEQGAPRLTHRAVAAESGMSLGSVSHKLRTRADLLNAAYEALYRRHGDLGEMTNRPDAPPPHEVVTQLAESVMDRIDPSLGAEELLLACARDDALQPFAARLRYLRGRSSGFLLAAIVGKPVSSTDAAIFSSFVFGVTGAFMSHESSEARNSAALADLSDLSSLFERDGAF